MSFLKIQSLLGNKYTHGRGQGKGVLALALILDGAITENIVAPPEY